VALVAGRAVREPGSDAGGDEPARHVHHRSRWLVCVPQYQAGRLSGADRGAERRAARRAEAPQLRPAHLHFLIFKPGFKTIASQVYTNDDPYLETDSQFGVTKALIGHYVKHEREPAPAPGVAGTWWSLEHVFVVEPGEARLPQPPITKKVEAPAS
jgi:hypothetical protein